MKPLIIGLTGASGSIYGIRLIQELAALGHKLHVIATPTAQKVILYELGKELGDFLEGLENQVTVEGAHDFFSPVASGSYPAGAMIIAPCSMGTLGAIAHGLCPNLLARAALVSLKEGRPLIILARETPLGEIELENMLKLSRAGALIYPASPAFYHHPKTMGDLVDFLIGKILDRLGISHELFEKWGENHKKSNEDVKNHGELQYFVETEGDFL